MAADFKLPELGESIESIQVAKILVAPGDLLAVDQPVLELETNKATIEVPSSVAGTVTAIHVAEGDKIEAGCLILSVEGDAADGIPQADGELQSPSVTPMAPAVGSPTRHGSAPEPFYEFRLPDLGDSISSIQVAGVLVKEGDTVAPEQAVLELETEKATIEAPCAAAGTVKQVHVSEGDRIRVGQLVLTLADAGPAAEPAAAPAPPAPEPEPAETAAAEQRHAQVLVIGAGPGGYPAAFHAADLGLQVTLVDLAPKPGGVCLYRGCIPSKALLHAAAAVETTKEARAFGLTCENVNLDIDKLRGWKESVVNRLTGGLGQLTKQRKIELVQGRARFEDGRTVSVACADGSEARITFDHAILATGSVPARVPSFPDSPRIMDSTGALELPDVPGKMLVVGGGYIGLELGQAYASFGTSVTLVEMLPDILAGADRDLVRVLEQRLKRQFAKIMVNTKVAAMRDLGQSVEATFETGSGEKTTDTFDRVLVCVGRKPVTEDLGLENTGVQVDESGFVVVDAQRRTGEERIFAVGDVAGQPMLAHKATCEGKVAAEAVAGRKTAYQPRAIPAIVFTDPEIAWTGVTEAEAKERGLDVKVCRFPWAASGRAATLGRGDGMTKIVADAGDGRVLGIGIAGPGAGELIGEAVLAIEMGATAEDLALTIHAHPTLSETIMEAAESFSGHSIHFAR